MFSAKTFRELPWIKHFGLWWMGGVLRGSGRGHPLFPAMAGWEMQGRMFCHNSGMGGVLRGCWRSHPLLSACLFVKCHSTFCILGVIAVGEVALHVVHPGWRMSSISAVAGEAAHCTQRSLFERCNGLTILDFGGWVGFSAVADDATHVSPLWQVGKCHRGCFAIILGWVGFRGSGRFPSLR